jgi:hypothetical protein
MGLGFEITPDDVFLVLERHREAKSVDDVAVKQAFDLLDGDEIEAAALQGDNLEEQTDCALRAIEACLIEEGMVTAPALFG